MTEQQILDKTIEYLDHNSLCFSDWRYCYCGKCNHIVAITWGEDKYAENIKNLIAYDPDGYPGTDDEVSCDYRRIMHSEFNIAYSIIKDLAQHGTDNTINALG